MTVITQRGAAAFAALSAGLVAALLPGIKPVEAQGLSTYPNAPFAVKVGTYLPSNSATRDQLGIDWLSYGATYDFRRTGTKLPMAYEVYLDYYDATKTTGPDSFRLRSQAKMAALGVANRYYFVPKFAPFQPYVGAGFGFYDMHAKSEDPGGIDNVYKAGIGAKLLVGAQITQGVLLEGEYNWVPEPKLGDDRVKLSGYQFRIGYRF